jgi:hypothetical protein
MMDVAIGSDSEPAAVARNDLFQPGLVISTGANQFDATFDRQLSPVTSPVLRKDSSLSTVVLN